MPNRIADGIHLTNIKQRHRRGLQMQAFYMLSLGIAFFVLIVLMGTVLNRIYGLAIVDVAVNPEVIEADFEGRSLDSLSEVELSRVLLTRIPAQLARLVHTNFSSQSTVADMSRQPLSSAINNVEYPELPETITMDSTLQDIYRIDQAVYNQFLADILALNVSQDDLLTMIETEIIKRQVIQAWNLDISLFNRDSIEEALVAVQEEAPTAHLEWRSWISLNFLTETFNPRNPAEAGIAPALLGSIWIMILVMVIAFPLGVGAAIYLEEYASDTWYNRIIETNIRNLAGVPSIIYGLLGLAIFVRTLGDLTGGSILSGIIPGIAGRDRGDTVLSAALTLSLLILPIIIIQTQEALKAVPSSIREASYGLGATKWQTISRQIFPAALPGILTGTIIAISRAVGETAPILVIGGSTFVSSNPNGPFSGFTALPLVIYNWTSDPNRQFQNAAGAAIIVLLILLLTLNSVAVILRNRASKRSV